MTSPPLEEEADHQLIGMIIAWLTVNVNGHEKRMNLSIVKGFF